MVQEGNLSYENERSTTATIDGTKVSGNNMQDIYRYYVENNGLNGEVIKPVEGEFIYGKEHLEPEAQGTFYQEEDYHNVHGERGQENPDTFNAGSNANPRVGTNENGNAIFLDDIINDSQKLAQFGFDDEKLTEIVMYGTQNNKQLKEKLNILKNNDKAINQILENQAKLSLDPNSSSFSVNRTEQFLKTVTYLKEEGYDFSKLKFTGKNGNTIDFVEFMGKYSKVAQNRATPLDGPIATEIYGDSRINGNPSAIASFFVKEEFTKNPKRFEQEYQKYLAMKGNSANKGISYSEFMINKYGFNLPREKDISSQEQIDIIASEKNITSEELLAQFEIARQIQIEKDRLQREQLIKLTTVKENNYGGSQR